MGHDLSAYLQDILDACNTIEDVTLDVTLEDYEHPGERYKNCSGSCS
jgi:hypothetical protein